MFYQGFSALMPYVRQDVVPLPRAAGVRAARAEADAARGMCFDIGAMKLSDRLRNPSAYRDLQRARRDALESLLIASPSRAVAECAVDLICAICEESIWSANLDHLPFDDDSRPEIDFQCAETAVLFGWTIRALGAMLNEISPHIVNRMLCEVRKRVFKPILAHEDYPFMRGLGAYPMTIVSDIILSAILLETDNARCGRVLKIALKLMDEVCLRHGRGFRPLSETVSEIASAVDLVAILRKISRGTFDLTEHIPSADWLDEILFSWIQGDWFNDPAGNGMKPVLSGSDIFRIGYAADDDTLTALGAQIARQNYILPPTVTARMMDRSACAMMENESGKPPRLLYAATRNNQLMAVRMPKLYCSLHVGGGRANAGDLALFSDGMPILLDSGSHSEHNVPVLANRTQLITPTQPCIADFQTLEDREIMSVDLTSAYPEDCRVRSCQRTVLTLRAERTIRLVDAIAFEEPSIAAFTFVTAAKPTQLSAAIRLGSVRMTWEGVFSIDMRPLSDGLTLIKFTAVEPLQQMLFAFNFECD